MPLALIVDTLETVPEALRGEYTAKDGKFFLSVDGLESHPDTAGLRSALAKEKEALKTIKAKTAEWEKLGKTSEEIAALVAAKEKEAEDALKKAGGFDEILAKHKKAWETEKANLETKLTGERDAAVNSERAAVVETKLTAALTKGKATVEGLDLLAERLGRRIKFETVDGKRELQIMGVDGVTAMMGSGAGGLATMDDLVVEAKKNYPSLFEGTGAGGSGTDPKSNRRDAGTKTMSRKEFDKLDPLEKAVRMKAGWKLYD